MCLCLRSGLPTLYKISPLLFVREKTKSVFRREKLARCLTLFRSHYFLWAEVRTYSETGVGSARVAALDCPNSTTRG